MMSNSPRTLERIARRVPVPEPAYDRLLRRRDRKERNRRVSAAVVATVVTLVSLAALMRTFGHTEHPAAPKPPGIFSGVGGWITYGDDRGIWATDPTRPGGPNDQIQLSTERGIPLAWSSDGSKLLIVRQNREPALPAARRNLFVLNADGTETYLITSDDIENPGGGWTPPDVGGSFSPDGSEVIYASKSSIYAIDTQGGTPRLLQTASSRWFSINGIRIRALLYNPTYSPDGTQIAYFDGAVHDGEGIAHQLRVMNADGSGTRVLVDDLEADRIQGLAWSPDGEQLAFGLGSQGIYIVDADGSGLALGIPQGAYPYWSPDGSRLSYQPRNEQGAFGPLELAAADGTHVVRFGYGRSGPWNPLVQPEQAEAPTASEGLTLTSPPPFVAALLVLVVGILLVRRRMAATLANGSVGRHPQASMSFFPEPD